jgi:hypothetical protein
VARLAFLLLILIITQWAICNKQALLFSLNQLIVLNAFCATCICVAITIFAWWVAFITLLDARCLVKLPISTLRTELQINFSHLNHIFQRKRISYVAHWVVGQGESFVILEFHLILAVLIQLPVGNHLCWSIRKRYFLKVLDLELWSKDIPPPELSDIACELTLTGHCISTESEGNLLEFDCISSDKRRLGGPNADFFAIYIASEHAKILRYRISVVVPLTSLQVERVAIVVRIEIQLNLSHVCLLAYLIWLGSQDYLSDRWQRIINLEPDLCCHLSRIEFCQSWVYWYCHESCRSDAQKVFSLAFIRLLYVACLALLTLIRVLALIAVVRTN